MEIRELTWDDFQGQPDEDDPALAHTKWKIGYNYAINKEDCKYVVQLDVWCKVDPASWTKTKFVELLKHQQGEQAGLCRALLHRDDLRVGVQEASAGIRVLGQLQAGDFRALQPGAERAPGDGAKLRHRDAQHAQHRQAKAVGSQNHQAIKPTLKICLINWTIYANSSTCSL